MNTEIQTWNPVLLAYLRSTTRELKFDWNAVAENVRLFASREQYLEAISITPALCRELFASDYTQFEKVLPSTDSAATTQLVAKSAVDIMQEYENMSYDELMEHVQVTEQNMKQRKEQIFSKVLTSLGGVTGMESTAATAMIGATLGIEYDQTRQAYSDNLAAREAERLKKIAYAEEQAERLRLDKERDVLKKRFEAGSVDGVGEDPLAKSAYKYGDSANLNDAGDKTTSDLDFIDSLPYDPNVTQALQNYMETDEFDVMLTELEREIDAMAPSKDAGEAPSELSEILKVLEVAAASKSESANVQQSKRIAPSSGLLSAPVENLKPEAVLMPNKAAELAAAEKTAPAGRNYLTPPAQAAPTVAKSAASAAAPQRQDPYDRTRRGGSSGVEAKTEGRGGDRSDSEDEARDGTKSGDNSSDSEEDWRSMRNRQKKSSDRKTGASTAAPREAPRAPARAPAAGFWGAYGKPTTAGVREAADEVAVRDSEDPRYNAFVAEYAAANNVRIAQESESDSDDSDQETPDMPTGDVIDVQVPKIQDYERVVELEEETPASPPSSPSRSEPAPAASHSAVPEHTFMPPLPPVSPPKAPLPVSVPLSAQLPPAPVQALSGSLGTAAGRRPRGKAGSIMSAGKSRRPAEAAQDIAEEPVAELEAPTQEISSTPPAQQSEVVATAPSTVAAIEVPAVVETPLPAPVVDPAVVAAEEAARVAALRAAAIQKAVSLDLLQAPVLSPLPCAYVSNKSSGTTAEFSTGSLPAQLTNHGVAVDRLVLVDVDLARLQAADIACYGDSPWVSIVAWVLQALGNKYGLMALQSGVVSTNGVDQSVCRMVLETRFDKYSASELLEAAKSAPLASVLTGYVAPVPQPGDDTPALSVADVLSIRDSYAAPLMADLEFFSAPLSDKAHMTQLFSAAGGMVSVRDVAVCAIRSHVLSSQLISSQYPRSTVANVLNALVSQAERAGLRLCGIRLVRLKARELFEYESFCSVPGHTVPVPPAYPPQEGTSAYHYQALPVLCLAFHSSNTHVSDTGATVNKTGTTSTTNTAATVLRALLGPDDPALALKTDPKSLRAQYGENKEHNLAYPIPHSADRLLKETSFWFGGRSPVAGVSRSVSLLSVAPPRTVRIGVTLKIPRTALNASSAARLSTLQTTLLSTISDSMGAMGQLRSLSTFASAVAYRVAIKAAISKSTRPDATSSAPATTVADASSGAAAQYLVWEFTSHVGDLYLDQCVANLIARTGSSVSEGSWTVAAEWSASLIEVAAVTIDESTIAADVAKSDALSGSKLLALDMLKKVAEDDCKSHEDVGLPDVVVLSIGDDSYTSTDPVMPVLLSVLSLLPRTCEATVLAVKSTRDGAGMLALLRGYQILENIDYAVSEMQRVLSGNSSPGRPSQQKAAAASNKAKFESIDTDHALCYTVKSLKGKRALEMIFTEFPLSSLFVDLALRDLHTYVPLPGLQRSGFTWLEQISHSAAQLAAQAAVTTSTDALVSAPAQYLQALFPPGVFTAIGAVLVPWLTDGASFTRNLARVIARLEKEHFEIVEIKAVSTVSEALVRQLYEENLNEYALNVRGSTGSTQSAVRHDSTCVAVVEVLKGRSAVAILVRRRSALLQLKSLIGPVFSAELAETQYPRSLACLLASLSSSGSSTAASAKASAAADAGVPLMLPTLSCASSLCVLEEVFPHFYASYEAQQAAVSLNSLSSSGVHAERGGADSANIEHLTEVTVGTGIIIGQALRVPLVDRINSAAGEVAGEIVLSSGDVDALRKQVDIAGIVITHALLQEVGVGVILESLHREGLVIRNAYTTHLTAPAIKQLQQLAGASSLSMKPAGSLLSAAPVLVLGLEGPSHSFVRFKSYSTVARSAAQLWKLSAAHVSTGVGAGSGKADTDVQGSDWGVLASSSSRLAKDLFKHCFDKIFGDDSAFAYSS